MMRRSTGFVPIVACVILSLAGCGGGGAGAGAPLGPTAQSLPQFLKLYRTPPRPPKRRHTITGADRARARAGGWQPVAATAPFSGGADTEMLMTDGTVMVHDACTSAWFDLTPDKTGSYVNGTWTQKASMPSSYAPLYFASAVLPDGKLIVNGGEYNFCVGAETTLGAIYDPVANTWTAVQPPSGWSQIGDAQSVVLANGTYMLGNCCASVQALLNESSMTWTQSGPGNGKHDTNSEEGWTLLKDGSVLTADVFGAPASERYSPGSNTWSPAGNVPVNLISGDEIGPQTLRPNGTVFVAGASGASAVYHYGSKTWTTGPNFPIVGGQQLDVADGPSSVLVDGTVMVPASPGLYVAPSYYFIFNGSKLVPIAGPPNAPNDSSYDIRLLMLPTGQILETDGSGDVEVYTSPRQALARSMPAIVSVPSTLTHGSTYSISGKRFNGLTQENMYGDDAQQATNFPLVRIVNNATGHVFYARTHDHSFMGVASGKTVSTKFDVPAGIETGASMLYVVCNGVASAPVNVTIN